MNVIKEYLVKIGAAVDFKQFAEVSKYIAKFTSNIGVMIAGALAAITVAVTAAVTAFMNKMAQADLSTQKLAISLYTTAANARSLKTVMDTMGIENLEDLKFTNLIPEQRKQFMELRALSRSLEPSDQNKEGLKQIREVGYAFQKLQVIFSYFLINVAGSLAQLLSSPMKKLVDILTKFSVTFQKNISKWALYLGAILTIVVKIAHIGIQLAELVGKVLGLIPFLDKIPPLLKLIIDVTLFLINKIEKVLDRLLGMDFKKGVKDLGDNLTTTFSKSTKALSTGISKSVESVKKTLHIGTSKETTIKKVADNVINFKNNTTLAYLKEVAKRENLRITSTTGGHHNTHSKHYLGQAIDFDHRGITNDKIARLRSLYGLSVRDERVRPRGQAVWGGAHFHADISPVRAAKFASQLQMTAKAPNQSVQHGPITINVNGVKDPHLAAELTHQKLQKSLGARNFRGPYV